MDADQSAGPDPARSAERVRDTVKDALAVNVFNQICDALSGSSFSPGNRGAILPSGVL
jgi:hypothetical protein